MTTEVPSDSSKSRLTRQLSLFDSTMIMMGIVIASGIFLTTGIMAKSIPSAGLILLAWGVGGLLTLAGALTYAELGAAMPEAGGQYVYLSKAYGPMTGFLFGWVMFLVYNSGGIAAVSAAFSEYFGTLVPTLRADIVLVSGQLKVLGIQFTPTLTTGQLVSVAVIIFLTIFNYLGLIFGKIIANIFSSIKVGTIIVFIVLGFLVGRGNPIDFSVPREYATMSISSWITGFGVSLIAVAWAFDGWNNINWVGGEIKRPKRNLPLALILGTLGITALYILANILYLYALPIGEIVGVVRIAEKATTALFGGPTGNILAVLIVISTFSSMNGSILTGPRVYYAMAKDALFFRRMAVVNKRFRTPGYAILVQGIWCSLLALSGTFEQLITFAMFVSIGFWIAATASVFTLRKKMPDLPRPYKTWGYPVVPIVFILASAGILINTLIEKPVESLAGVFITLLGIPVFLFWKKRADKTSA